ncbi:multisubunit potassium/proton antiporter, PhaG subunit [Poseidonocella pacifica]|uniref:Multisubunit potassium/proton antiporter, PhaG subunit n=1 Tax=Poseidonocella pacifica TaxID=871651 RepID=A0A1I0X7C4_9RHOB|nr:Na+/H+ antiporter subunit G [Poseidonocella pacifica]SFA96821.1 multisubunit potassium/proton antiporter, PhaG subunit [Poseidonocella pacifica]
MLSEIFISALLVIGGVFGLVGSYGLVKLRDAMQRLHAPTKATTVGIGGILCASIAIAWLERGVASTHELLITLFLFVTAPVTANFIAKAYMHRNIEAASLPQTETSCGWAGYAPPPGENEPPSGDKSN